MATTSVLESKPRHIFARRFLELVIPPKIKQPTPNLIDSQNLAMFYYTELSEISEIIKDSLYLSGCSPVTNDNLESLGITAIVCALSENEERRMMNDRQLPGDIKKMYVRLIDADFSDISVHFETAARFIHEEIENGRKVLVHCAAGISRSSSLIMAYLMKYRHYDLKKSFNLVKTNRRVVRPNNGFFQKLIDYERSIYGDEHIPSVQMIKHSEDETEDRLIPDVVLEAAKRVDVNDWRHLA